MIHLSHIDYKRFFFKGELSLVFVSFPLVEVLSFVLVYNRSSAVIVILIQSAIGTVESSIVKLGSNWMSDHISMLVSDYSPLDETLNRGHWRFSRGDSMNLPLKITQCNFSFQ